MNKTIETIIEYAKKTAAEQLCGTGDFISAKGHNGYMYITKPNVDFAKITEADVEKVEMASAESKEYSLHARIYDAKQDVNAICHVHPKWVAPVAKVGKTIPAVLDDMAQLVGPTCKTSENDNIKIVKTLSGRNSCLIKEDGCITTGRSMDEAYTCVLVLDKASHCFVSSSVIGKNVIINGFESRLMRFIYKKKYSKVNQENLQAREGEED